MASRQFLKILQEARFGDVSAQQNLAFAYLSGAFKTPIQPANALIWLEKSYFSISNQLLIGDISNISRSHIDETPEPTLLALFELVTSVPLAKTIGSSAFIFGWNIFWKISELNIPSSHHVKWQLAELLLDADHETAQTEIKDWHEQREQTPDFLDLVSKAKEYLLELADSHSEYRGAAKTLLIKLQPKDEALSSLWNVWISEKNEPALWKAAEQGLAIARVTVGLKLARLDRPEPGKAIKSNASLKKAAYWLELAAKDGDRDAWFALGQIYRRPQFSGYSAAESDRCFDRAADLGHAQAQFRKGANLWRKRERIEEQVRGLQASYWIWQAHQQAIPQASELLSKILINVSDPALNDWHEMALKAERILERHAEYQLEDEWILMCHRLIIANQFNLTKAELLLSEISQLQHEHCVVVDIRHALPKILPKLIKIDTTQQRRTLLAAGKTFVGVEPDQEGNLRQRRYRFDRVTEWLSNSKMN